LKQASIFTAPVYRGRLPFKDLQEKNSYKFQAASYKQIPRKVDALGTVVIRRPLLSIFCRNFDLGSVVAHVVDTTEESVNFLRKRGLD
jgi:hypothetical protein